MDFEMWAGLIALLVLVLVGVPVVFAFAASAAFGLYFVFGGFEPVVNLLQQSAISGIKDYNFVVIPLFTVMGMLIAHCGAAGDLFSVVNRMLKGIPGRLAVATVGGNAIFAAVTGVGVAAAAAFSHVAYPVMRENRYSRSFAVGCIAGSSVLGLLIPPSVFMIVWAILTEQSVGTLFAAGVFPGIVLAALYVVYCVVYAKLFPKAAPELADDAPQVLPLSRRQVMGSLAVGVLIVITLGGIWLGYFTPTEGSAVGLLGAAILAIGKGMRLEGLFKAFFDRCYYDVLDELNGRPYGLLIAAGSDGQGAVRQAEKICTGWRLQPVAPASIVLTHAQTAQAIAAPKNIKPDERALCEELGGTVAALLL
ncbi:TRAP transporter large permease subunit [Neopusillimonas maritima]|uniref:TRAP C4-dicarboxylate transport system permease DctM subunit domain-containing protein n=1 Tax=Neopusillimonas maritima TaxID=2026239 RepID=A0A3A1YS69_9BURK|nr:TRAP transporter large permease subunit [Neopusillimonas maritima]RIY39224.1 hypothetical protein CJP73_15070 [Neopusillimonas maritima]